MKHRIRFVLLVILAIVVIGIIAWKVVLNIDASLPDLSGKPDGVYRGIYSVPPTPVKVELEVTVRNGKLDKIDLVKHAASKIGKRAEIIIPVIIEKQSLDIDAVGGATASSKAILKAVENALQ
jgi:uncharacterized protein with FMN-binding domain